MLTFDASIPIVTYQLIFILDIAMFTKKKSKSVFRKYFPETVSQRGRSYAKRMVLGSSNIQRKIGPIGWLVTEKSWLK